MISRYRGDTWERSWRLVTKAGAVVDLTGISAVLQLRKQNGELVFEASIANSGLQVSAAEGRLELLPTSTSELSDHIYKFDLEISYPNGRVRTIERNSLKIRSA